jgi:hypothetical protein
MFHGLGCVMLLRFVICDFSLWFVVLFLFRDPAGFFLFFFWKHFLIRFKSMSELPPIFD